ncbi:hypothetical protein N7492_000600 [Penicillium capsulatum]|uniref:Ubiquitin-like protease family profile domain-containing protein n=1 Tax=Penicillium capsulatum TaxID=69766 RepID=A0A9W9IPV6_9EURO|nr:hypothetical protein N7492_000600 [Penicillium capsulatum]KAJ6130342.1 hypothetical protein N7512_003122 [Penicillium capsulatum]
MSFFGSFADVLAKFSPRRPHHRPHPSLSQHSDTHPHRPHSQSPTPHTPWRKFRKKNDFSLGLDEDDIPEELPERSLVNATPELNVQSDDSSVSLISRGKLRSSTSQFDTDPRVRRGQRSQMSDKEKKRLEEERQEEYRLLGRAKGASDEGAVKIIPGHFHGKAHKKPGSSAAFKPWDNLPPHARQSGPVRSQDKPKQSQLPMTKTPQRRRQPPDDFEDPDRATKRPRYDKSNLDIEHESTPDQLSRMSPSPSQSRHRRFSVDTQDEQFTAKATQQRRSLNSDQQSPESHKPSYHPAATGLIEAPTGRNISRQVLSPPVELNGSRRIPSPRESPDELQGEATTQPIPKTLNEKLQKTRTRQQVHENLMSPSRKRSPTDIQPTDFTGSPRQGPKRAKRSHKASRDTELEVTSFRFGNIASKFQKGEAAVVDLSEEGLTVGEDIAGTQRGTSILLRHVVQAFQGQEPSRKIRLKLAKKADNPSDKVDIELLTVADKLRLVKALQAEGIKPQAKDMTFMDRAFAVHEREMTEHAKSSTQPFLEIIDKKPIREEKLATQPALRSTKRQRVSSALQDSSDEPAPRKRKVQDETGNLTTVAENPSENKRGSSSGVEIPVKTTRETKSRERETRATARQTSRESDRLSKRHEGSPAGPWLEPLENDTTRKKWKKALVYPQAGKKRAEVTVEDRDRLREGEFLNDNLIGLYMRFLQDHLERTNPEAAKRVYFFNSYFFATLTNLPKGDRGINYGGVEKWTRNVDLFSYDYIVVPINQNAHWFVAIICNLPSMCPGTVDPVESKTPAVSDQVPRKQPESEVYEIPESPENKPCSTTSVPKANGDASPQQASESPDSHETRQSLASMSLEGQKNQRDPEEAEKQSRSADEWPDCQENQSSQSTNFSSSRQSESQTQAAASSQAARKPKKKTRTGPKLALDQTTIITLDSLGHSRSPTIRGLREYIIKEADSKRGIDVDPAGIKGMCARQIPLQPNFSDCGLYLLAYLEKFVQDPDHLTRKLLRREMDEQTDWPPLGSGLLRHRLRNFLDELYDEQARSKLKRNDSAIMADQRPISFLLGPSLPSQDTEDHTEDASAHYEEAQSTKTSVTQSVIKTPAATESPVQEAPDLHDEAADVPELVPTRTIGATWVMHTPSEKNATGTEPGKHPRPKETESLEVPDSQEHNPDLDKPPDSRDVEKKRKKTEEPTRSRKSERKKNITSIGTDVATVTKNQPKASKVEVQVPRTPPPNDELVRKSPRGNPKK